MTDDEMLRKRAEDKAERNRCEVLAATLLNEATQGAYDAEDITQWADKIEKYTKIVAAEQSALAREAAIAECQGMIVALRYYANQHHFLIADERAWDTVSGEPQNFHCDEAGTATVEDGTIAKLALRGEAIHWIEDGEDCSPKPIECERLSAGDRVLVPRHKLRADELRITRKETIRGSSIPEGIRDRHGFLFFFYEPQYYEGQQERYAKDIEHANSLADYILQSLLDAGKD